MLSFFGSMASIAFIVYLVLAIRSKKKGSPKAKHQFKIMWVSLAVVVLVGIINPNKAQTTQTAQPEQAAASQEVSKAEPAQAQPSTATETTTSETKKQSDDQQVASATNKTETASEPVKAAEGKETIYVESDTTTTQALDKEAVLAYAGILRGSPFIKDVNVGKNDISIAYFSSFKQYKAANPQSQATQDIYNDYFSTGDEINKILMEESTRLLKEFPAANEIKITLPFGGDTYSVDLKEDEAEQFYEGVNFDTLKTSDPVDGNSEWRAQISDKYFNKVDRQSFVDQFVQVN